LMNRIHTKKVIAEKNGKSMGIIMAAVIADMTKRVFA